MILLKINFFATSAKSISYWPFIYFLSPINYISPNIEREKTKTRTHIIFFVTQGTLQRGRASSISIVFTLLWISVLEIKKKKNVEKATKKKLLLRKYSQQSTEKANKSTPTTTIVLILFLNTKLIFHLVQILAKTKSNSIPKSQQKKISETN